MRHADALRLLHAHRLDADDITRWGVARLWNDGICLSRQAERIDAGRHLDAQHVAQLALALLAIVRVGWLFLGDGNHAAQGLHNRHDAILQHRGSGVEVGGLPGLHHAAIRIHQAAQQLNPNFDGVVDVVFRDELGVRVRAAQPQRIQRNLYRVAALRPLDSIGGDAPRRAGALFCSVQARNLHPSREP